MPVIGLEVRRSMPGIFAFAWSTENHVSRCSLGEMNGIVAGCSSKAIAHALGISPRTVDIHRARLMRDLGVRHVAEVVRLALEAGDFER